MERPEDENSGLAQRLSWDNQHPVKRVSCQYTNNSDRTCIIGHCQRKPVISLTKVMILGILSLHMVGAGDISCQGIRYTYYNKGLDTNDIPRSPQQGIHLKICPRGVTCCTPEMESKLWTISRETFTNSLASSNAHILATFHSKSRKFDEFFTELLSNAKLDFHLMFKKTYGILYERNSDVFTDFFKDLEAYYENGNVDLEEALRKFFTHLYQRMFTVLNSQYSFDSRYLECVSQNMKKLQPFGDIPQKLTLSLRRSFVATRTFAQALLEGKKILGKIIKIAPRDKCTEALTKMTSCPYCQGLPAIRPCSSYCHNVMKGCLAYHAELSDSWDKFADSLIAVGERLIGPFNIEDVVGPIVFKISDAIMKFQDSGYEVTQKVFQDCGQPSQPRLGKRQSEFGYGVSQTGRKSKDRPMKTPTSGTNLDNLVNEIMTKVKDTKGFWTRLPSILCQNPEVGSGKERVEQNCWNGRGRGVYSEHKVVGNGLAAQANNPEVEVDQDQDQDINEQIFALKLVTNKLENAYNGHTVEWPHYSSKYPNDSGYWSGDCYDDEDCFMAEGSGSGDDDENRDQDMEDNGSGDSDYEDIETGPEDKPDWPPWLQGGSSSTTDISIEEEVAIQRTNPTTTGGSPQASLPSFLSYLVILILLSNTDRYLT